jgi:transposase-like protein
MKEAMLGQFSFSEEFKEKLVLLVMYKNQSVQEVAKSYRLPNSYILVNWITRYKKNLEKGAVTVVAIDPKKKNDKAALNQQVKQLEKALEKANVLIYGLNAMIDYAEKELKVPVRKKRGSKQSIYLKKSGLPGWVWARFADCLENSGKHIIKRNGT